MKKFKILLPILAIATAVATTIFILKPTKSDNTNINASQIIKHKNEYYYVLGEKPASIYKTDGTSTTKLHTFNENFSGSSILIIDDWIYFSDKYENTSLGLFRMKTNGKKLELVCKNKPSGSLRFYNGYFYIGNEYKMKKNDTEFTQFYDKESATGYTINYVDNKIFFFEIENGINGIFKMSTDGENKEKIFDGRADYMTIDNEWIYFQDQEEFQKHGLYKMKKDGSEVQKLLGDKVWTITVDNEWIYCDSHTDGIDGLYKVKTDGSEYHLLKEREALYDYIYIIDDWIYYAEQDESDEIIRRMKLDGSEDQIFTEIEKLQ